MIFPFPAVMTNENVDNALAIGLIVTFCVGIPVLCIVVGIVAVIAFCFKAKH